jgi:formiminoglutamase
MGDAVNCINLDAHSDYRMMEGRHSGNGFRYAKADGYLARYAIVGLHRNYNSNAVLSDLSEDADIHHAFYEDIFLWQEQSFKEAITAAIAHTKGLPTGIELDLDCIERVLSSAATPCGITTLEARQYLVQCAGTAKPAYLHLTEGAAELRDGRKDGSTAKLIAYLVSDFIKAFR